MSLGNSVHPMYSKVVIPVQAVEGHRVARG
jgi:hypothetical protein